jgi:hypothetical protein
METRAKRRKRALLAFPHGDTLGIVLGFMSAREILQGKLFVVAKEWIRVLRTLPHAWGAKLDLRWATSVTFSGTYYAWNRVTVGARDRSCRA